MVKPVTILFLILCSFLNSHACDCDNERQPVKELFKKSKAVFIGTVISHKESSKTTGKGIYKQTFQELQINISQTFSGDALQSVTILRENTGCGQSFEAGKKYLFYTYYDNETKSLSIHRCFSYCPDIESDLGKKDLDEIHKIGKR